MEEDKTYPDLLTYSAVNSQTHQMHIGAFSNYAERSGRDPINLRAGILGCRDLIKIRPKGSTIFVQSTGLSNLLFLPLTRWLRCKTLLYLHEPTSLKTKLSNEDGLIKSLAMQIVQKFDCMLSSTVLVSNTNLKAVASEIYGISDEKIEIAPLLMPEADCSSRGRRNRITYIGRPDKRRYLAEFILAAEFLKQRGLRPTILTGNPGAFRALVKNLDLSEVDVIAISRFPESLKAEVLAETRIVWNPKRNDIAQSGVTADAIRFGLISVLTLHDPYFERLLESGLAVDFDVFMEPDFQMSSLKDEEAAVKTAEQVFGKLHGYDAFRQHYLPNL